MSERGPEVHGSHYISLQHEILFTRLKLIQTRYCGAKDNFSSGGKYFWLLSYFSDLKQVLLTSCERVHKGGLWHGGDRVDQSRLALGLANLRVGFSKLQADRLGQVRIEPHSLLQQNEVKSDAGPYWAMGEGGQVFSDHIRLH